MLQVQDPAPAWEDPRLAHRIRIVPRRRNPRRRLRKAQILGRLLPLTSHGIRRAPPNRPPKKTGTAIKTASQIAPIRRQRRARRTAASQTLRLLRGARLLAQEIHRPLRLRQPAAVLSRPSLALLRKWLSRTEDLSSRRKN